MITGKANLIISSLKQQLKILCCNYYLGFSIVTRWELYTEILNTKTYY